MRAISRRRPNLDARLAALRAAAENAHGRLPDEVVAQLEAVLDRAGQRLGLGTELTVVALAGSTGSGKSSLFNQLAGAELSQVGVRRPTTASAQASVFGDAGADELLDWLQVAQRHRVSDGELDGLVLLDLPDHDSTEVEHRVEVDRLIELVDLFVWVVDPQKYADALLHDGYLKPLATHAPVTLIALNHADRLNEEERRKCIADLGRLLTADGMKGVPVHATSARTGEGLDDLRRVIGDRVARRRAAAERLASDVDRAVDDLTAFCGSQARGVERGTRGRLVATLADAGGGSVVVEAVAKSHRREAALATGWPLTRWLRRLRPDPLRRLHLKESTGGKTSLRAPSPVQHAQVENAIRSLVQDATVGMPQPWPTAVLGRVGDSSDDLLRGLDSAISEMDFDERRPRWWALASALQVIVATAAVVGFLWLTLLFVLEWLQIPRPPVPNVNEEIPVPTILLVGGLLVGFVLGALFGGFARVGAARRRSRANARLLTHVEAVADSLVVQPVDDELRAYGNFCAELSAASESRS